MPPLLSHLLKLLVVVIIWYLGTTSAQDEPKPFTIPGGVHYHWIWDPKENRYIRRVYESHENYTFVALKLTPREHPATRYVLIGLITLCSLSGLATLIYALYVVTMERKMKRSFDLERQQQKTRQPKSNGDYEFFKNVDISLQQKLGNGKFGSVYRALVEPKVEDDSLENPQPLQGQNSSLPSTSTSTTTTTTKTTTNVAIKVFVGSDERSLAMERYVYDLPGMAHPNLLRYLASFELRFPLPTPEKGDLTTFLWNKKLKTKKNENLLLPPLPIPIFWLVTEYHPTGSLYNYLSLPGQQPLTTDQLLTLVHGLASGLSFLHNFDQRRGVAIALRDFKSANVILSGQNPAELRPLIADLGLAVVFYRDFPVAGDPKERVGTPRYMAPEVLTGKLDVLSSGSYLSVDMYALGLVLWELLSQTKVNEKEILQNYRPPYQEYLGNEGGTDARGPTVAEMHSLVVGRRLRPSVKKDWFDPQKVDTVVWVVSEAIVDCWDVDGEARLKSATLLARMEVLLAKKKEGRGKEKSDKESDNEKKNEEKKEEEVKVEVYEL